MPKAVGYQSELELFKAQISQYFCKNSSKWKFMGLFWCIRFFQVSHKATWDMKVRALQISSLVFWGHYIKQIYPWYLLSWSFIKLHRHVRPRISNKGRHGIITYGSQARMPCSYQISRQHYIYIPCNTKVLMGS